VGSYESLRERLMPEIAETAKGPIEYDVAGEGAPVLVVGGKSTSGSVKATPPVRRVLGRAGRTRPASGDPHTPIGCAPWEPAPRDGKVVELAVNRLNDSELAGAISPDGKTLFVNSFGDPAGTAAPDTGNEGMTIAITGPWGKGPL
jgi:hypothetical protein